LFISHYLVPVFLLQLIGGALLLADRFVHLALALIAPVIVNILLFHCLIAPEGLPPASVTVLLWVVIFLKKRSSFAGLFAARVMPKVGTLVGSSDNFTFSCLFLQFITSLTPEWRRCAPILSALASADTSGYAAASRPGEWAAWALLIRRG
jgi:hypothetical protein